MHSERANIFIVYLVIIESFVKLSSPTASHSQGLALPDGVHSLYLGNNLHWCCIFNGEDPLIELSAVVVFNGFLSVLWLFEGHSRRSKELAESISVEFAFTKRSYLLEESLMR